MAPADAWMDGLAEGVVLVSDGVVTRINAAAGRILGADPPWAAGKRLISVVRDHRLEGVWLHGREVELNVRGTLVQAAPIVGGIALRDVSEAREAREDARRLLAVLSHELRTPMTTVRSTLDALHYDDLPVGERARLLERAVQEADRVVRLLDDLTIDVTPPRERSVSLAAMAERACAILAPTLEAHGLTVRRALGSVMAWADADKVLQVLLNLIENATVHGPCDSRIDITATVRADWALVTVRDDGSPLPPAMFAKLFQPFAYGSESKGMGLGLGLYVVRSIAERWGGRAWGRVWRQEGGSGVGEGNEFGVLVPLNRGASQALRPDIYIEDPALDGEVDERDPAKTIEAG
ncbi:MAG: ATP-binding protein [Trueperaceae bacterium]